MTKEAQRQLLTDILMSDHAGNGIEQLHKSGSLKEILPEIDAEFDMPQNNPYHVYNVGEHTMHALDYTPEDLCVRLAVLLHDSGKVKTHCQGPDGIDHFYGHEQVSGQIAEEVCKRFGFSEPVSDTVVKLVKAHEYRSDPDKVDRFLYKYQDMTDEEMMQLMAVQYADVMAQAPDLDRQKKRLDMKTALEQALTKPHRISELAFSKRDVLSTQQAHNGMTLPLSDAEADGIMLRLLKEVLKDPGRNTQEDLADIVRKNLINIRMSTIARLSEPEKSRQNTAMHLRKEVDRDRKDVKCLAEYETENIKWISDEERRNT